MGKLLDTLKTNGVEITEEIETKVMNDFVEKKDFDLQDTEISNLKEQLKTRDKDIDDLKKVDGAKLQDELKTLQDKYKTETEALQTKLRNTEFDNALEIELMGVNAKDTGIVKTLLDREKIAYKDGKFEGLTEQIDQFKKEKDFLFNAEEQQTTKTYTYKPNGGGTETAPGTLNDAIAQAMGLQQ